MSLLENLFSQSLSCHVHQHQTILPWFFVSSNQAFMFEDPPYKKIQNDIDIPKVSNILQDSKNLSRR